MVKRFYIGFMALWLLAGCNVVEERIIYESSDPPPAARPSASAQPNAEIIERRFVDPNNQSDAVNAAVRWAEKYEKLVEQNVELREKHNQLFTENAELRQQLKTTQADLERTQKELKEADAFLHEMHTELNNWKSDVLGFRQEMRQAQKAQLQALSRVLQILGAEPIRPADEESQTQSERPSEQ